MSDEWLIAVTAGRWQQHGIREARKAGFHVLAVDEDPNASGMKDANLSLVTKLSDLNSVCEEIERHKLDVRGAISFCSEAGMDLTARLRDKLNLPGPRSELTTSLTDKGQQRDLWKKKGVPGPDFSVATNIAEARKTLKSSAFPVILKPCDSAGSRGISVFESSDEIQDEKLNNAFIHSNSGRVIIEKFMKGLEHTVEMFSVAGVAQVLAVTEKRKVPGTRGTVAIELSSPRSADHLVQKIENAAKQAIDSMGYSSGPSHCEVILMPDGEVGLVEVAGRGGGFNVFDKFIPAVSGVNIARLSALAAGGRTLDNFKIARRKGVLRFFPSQVGKLKSIIGFDAANRISGVESAPFATIGETYGPPTDDGSRLGFILSVGNSLQEALAKANNAESKITFSFE
jgi:biotin carboxylase